MLGANIFSSVRILGAQPDNTERFYKLLNSLPEAEDSTFSLQKTSPDEVLKLIQELRSKCSTVCA